MLNRYAKKAIAKAWEYVAYRNCINKLKLYGKYNTMYEWNEYKRIEEHKRLFAPLTKKVSTEWYKYFTLIRQEEDVNYIPEDLWHIKIEPVLNNKYYMTANNDKNLFHFSCLKPYLPQAFLHVIMGICYKQDLAYIKADQAFSIIPDNTPLIVKKSIDTGGGKGVVYYDNKSQLGNISELKNKHGQDFVVQQFEEQHPWFARFNHTSVNTIRVMTYRSVKTEEIIAIQSLLRVGKPGSVMDNQSSGGVAVGINKTGEVNNWGSDKLSNKFLKIGDVNLSDVGIIPKLEETKALCIELAKQRPYERVLVFDTWRDKYDRIRIMEVNNVNIGIEDLQKNNGALFGAYTSEVIDYCASNPKFYCFSFDSLEI